MKRRTAILSLGGLVAGGGAAMGTGAFTSVESERQTSVTIQDDTGAYLSLEPARSEGENTPIAQEDPFSRIDEDTGRIEINVTALNDNAKTEIGDLFEIRHQGVEGQSATVFIEHDAEDVIEFFAIEDGNRVVLSGESEGVELTAGDTVVVNLEADTFETESDPEIIDTITVKASSRGDDQ